VSNPSQGYLPGLEGALKSTEGVIDARVYENYTGTTDGLGIPGHSIWAIVDCPDTAEARDAVALTIYKKRALGCGMTGDEYVDIVEVNGTTFSVQFDFPVYEDLYIKLYLQSLDPDHAIDAEYLTAQIYALITYTIYQPADLTAIITLVKQLDPLAVVRMDLEGGVSANESDWLSFIYPSTVQARWLLSVANINLLVET
jgi:hypothetical protein